MSDNTSIPSIDDSVAGIVLTAQIFNPSIFSETWLVQNDVIPKDTFTGIRIFSHEVVQFSTNDIQVLVIPPKMQIVFQINDPKGDYSLPIKIVSKTVELLPQTPYQAVGLNFDYSVSPPPDRDFNDYDRTLLGDGSYKLLDEFAAKDAKFGRYFSMNFHSARLKLTIIPMKKTKPDSKDFLRFSFNFHFDLTMNNSPDLVSKLINHFDSWPSLREYSLKLVEMGSLL